MPKAAKSRSGSNVSTETEMYDTDTILLKMTELLCDEQILKKMKTTLFPQELSDKLDHLSAQVEVLTKQLATKEQRITELEKKVATLEAQTDAVEQYSRRANLRFQGIPDSDGEDTDSLIITLINEQINVEPRVQNTDIERSHRVGPKVDKQGRRRVRPIIVRFAKERTRDVVYRARFRLKDVNAKRPLEKIFINENLTSTRASLAAEARPIKKAGKIQDTWTYNGNILIKNARSDIIQVREFADLAPYK